MTRIAHYLLLVLPPVMPATIRRRHPPHFVPLLRSALQSPVTKVLSKLKTLEKPTDSYDTSKMLRKVFNQLL